MPATIPDKTRRRWEASGNKSQRVALLIGQWAEGQQPGTIVPADDVLMTRYPKVNDRYGQPYANDARTVHRAIRNLSHMHVIYRDHDTGHYHVAATQPPAQEAPEPAR